MPTAEEQAEAVMITWELGIKDQSCRGNSAQQVKKPYTAPASIAGRLAIESTAYVNPSNVDSGCGHEMRGIATCGHVQW